MSDRCDRNEIEQLNTGEMESFWTDSGETVFPCSHAWPNGEPSTTINHRAGVVECKRCGEALMSLDAVSRKVV